MKSLFDEVRTQRMLFSAWRHIKTSALNSPDGKIRGEAAFFENSHQTHLARISTQLRNETFSFGQSIGVVKDKKKRESQGKRARPIAIANIESRIVQRSILQVLQPRKPRDPRNPRSKVEVSFDPRLGKINEVNKSNIGIGGLVGSQGGVEPAIRKIIQKIDAGYSHYFRSDIKEFFTKIPVENVVNEILQETNDTKFANLFKSALVVQLSNADALSEDLELFPQGGIGVAQGSSLSAFAGNLLLYEIDRLTIQPGVAAIRYIDDYLILSTSEEKLNRITKQYHTGLQALNLESYDPNTNSEKAAIGLCKSGIDFLGCRILGTNVSPSINKIASFEMSIDTQLANSKRAIEKYLQNGKPIDRANSRTKTFEMIGQKLYGWQKAYEFCTNKDLLVDLNTNTSAKLRKYDSVVFRWLRNKTDEQYARVIGYPTPPINAPNPSPRPASSLSSA